jgi:hypothetical protein
MTNDAWAAHFISGEGKLVNGQEVIFPIMHVRQHPPEVACIGTGFFITTSGVFATAAHVLRAAIGKDEEPDGALFTIQFVPPDKFLRRSILKCTLHGSADVAVGALETLFLDRAPLRNKTAVLTTATPQKGERIATWAYPGVATKYAPAAQERFRASLKIVPKVNVGEVLNECRAGRDAVMLPGPCYETNLALEGGSSGGPVFNGAGQVFAVNSTGYEGTDIAFISHIQSIGGLPIADYQTGDGVVHPNITIHELIQMGHLAVDQGRKNTI